MAAPPRRHHLRPAAASLRRIALLKISFIHLKSLKKSFFAPLHRLRRGYPEALPEKRKKIAAMHGGDRVFFFF